MSYHDYLAARGYRRVTVERTEKAPGDLVLASVTQPVELVPPASRVVPMRRSRA